MKQNKKAIKMIRSIKRENVVHAFDFLSIIILLSRFSYLTSSKGDARKYFKYFMNLLFSRNSEKFWIHTGGVGEFSIATFKMIVSTSIKVDKTSIMTIYLRILGIFRDGPFIGNLLRKSEEL